MVEEVKAAIDPDALLEYFGSGIARRRLGVRRRHGGVASGPGGHREAGQGAAG